MILARIALHASAVALLANLLELATQDVDSPPLQLLLEWTETWQYLPFAISASCAANNKPALLATLVFAAFLLLYSAIAEDPLRPATAVGLGALSGHAFRTVVLQPSTEDSHAQDA